MLVDLRGGGSLGGLSGGGSLGGLSGHQRINFVGVPKQAPRRQLDRNQSVKMPVAAIRGAPCLRTIPHSLGGFFGCDFAGACRRNNAPIRANARCGEGVKRSGARPECSRANAWCGVVLLHGHTGPDAAGKVIEAFGHFLVGGNYAVGIVVFITWLVYKGIYETKMAGNIMVLTKIGILMLVVAVGSFYIDPKNWSPFAPNGIGGVLKGVSGVFFAYIGFDAISTTAEECRNPRRDLPRSMIYALAITTLLYVTISLVLTGMVPFSQLGVSDPLAFAFEKLHLTRLSGIIALGSDNNTGSGTNSSVVTGINMNDWLTTFKFDIIQTIIITRSGSIYLADRNGH